MLHFAPETLPRLTCVKKTNKISGAFRRKVFIKDINIAPAWLPAIFSKYIFPAKFPALRLGQEKQWFYENRYFFRKRCSRRTRHETCSRLGPSHFFRICFSGGISGAPSGPRKTMVSLRLFCFEKTLLKSLVKDRIVFRWVLQYLGLRGVGARFPALRFAHGIQWFPAAYAYLGNRFRIALSSDGGKANQHTHTFFSSAP